MSKNVKINLAIIGYGRFGKLLSKILSPYANVSIVSREKIKEKNLKQIDYPDLLKFDWIVPAVPISSLEETLQKISPFLKKDCLVMDVCSVKVKPCQWLKKYLPKNVHLLGSHPMFGPDSAKHGLESLQIVFCPIRISDKKYSQIINIFKKLKLNIIETSPSEHDKQNALSLALVHFIGRGFEKITKKDIKITTLGFKKLLQVGENVSNDTWQLFYDINNYNPYSEKTRAFFIESLQNIDFMLKLKILEKYNSIDVLRNNILKIDTELFRLIKERQENVKKIGIIKKKNNLPIRDVFREEKLIKQTILRSKLDEDFIRALYKLIFNQSYKLER